jgi:hypothetical protein
MKDKECIKVLKEISKDGKLVKNDKDRKHRRSGTGRSADPLYQLSKFSL